MRHSGGGTANGSGVRAPTAGEGGEARRAARVTRSLPLASLYGFGPEVRHGREPVGARILLAVVAVIGQIGGPAALEALPGAHRGDGRVALVLVAPARIDAELDGELRFIETQCKQ